ncbi:MAG: hypothetical protein ACR2QK_14400, partial [Acidimicrobiales bacterium]
AALGPVGEADAPASICSDGTAIVSVATDDNANKAVARPFTAILNAPRLASVTLFRATRVDK